MMAKKGNYLEGKVKFWEVSQSSQHLAGKQDLGDVLQVLKDKGTANGQIV
jgi:hypothetical protein